jgi:hypothetical protein
MGKGGEFIYTSTINIHFLFSGSCRRISTMLGNNFAAPHVCLWKIPGDSEFNFFNFVNALDFTIPLLLLVSMLILVSCFLLSRDEISGYSMMLLVLLLMLLELN